MTGPFAAHPGIHAAGRRPSRLALFFRRAIAAVRRRPAAPALSPAGAARGGGSLWDDAAPRFACCAHCLSGSPCEPPGRHPLACPDGCNAPVPAGPVAGPAGVPVLGDRWTWQVREQWNTWHDGEPAAPAPWRPGPLFVPAAEIGTCGRRTPPGVENPAAAGGAPGAERARSGPPAPGVAHAQAMHELSARYLPAPEAIGGYPVTYARPVNGRSLGAQPRRQPVYGQAPQLEVERAMALAAGERARERYEPASPRLLEQVRAGLEKL